jgi:putative ABC transport system permease protein
LSGRIALRDAGRNRSSAAPAIAAVMAAVIGCVAALIGVASADDQNRRNYSPGLPMNDGYVSNSSSKVAPAAVADAVRASLPGARVAAITVPNGGCSDQDPSQCDSTSVTTTDDFSSGGGYLASGFFPSVVVDDGSTVETLLHRSAPDAVAALRAGRVVAGAPSLVHNGSVDIRISRDSGEKAVTVPAVEVDRYGVGPTLILPPQLVARLGLKTSASGSYVDTAHRLTEHETQVVTAALAKISPDLGLIVETGYHDDKLWMMLVLVVGAAVIAIGATMIATALSNVDSRPDLTTLGAVGAAPRTRRLLSMSRAGVIAGIGTVLGAAAGFVPSIAWINSQSISVPLVGVGSSAGGARLHLVVPWLPFTLIVIVVPVVAILIAGLFSRSRLPSERPAD